MRRDRFLAVVWLALATATAFTAPAVAQQGGAETEPDTFRPVSPVVLFRTSNVLLLQSRAIQAELELTGEQRSRQDAILKQQEEKLRAARELGDRDKIRAAWLGMNVPGCDNRQMALNIMHWLSGLLD